MTARDVVLFAAGATIGWTMVRAAQTWIASWIDSLDIRP